MRSPKQLRRELADLTTHLTQVQQALAGRANTQIAGIGKECVRAADALGQLLRSHQVPDTYKVAVVGRFKVGKSSFVNELLGTRLASEGTLPETAAVTTFKHGPRIQAAIRFIQRTDWEDLKALHRANPKETEAHRVSSWWGFLEPKKEKDGESPLPTPDLNALERAHVFDQPHTVVLEHSAKDTQKATQDFRRELKKYTSSSSPLHCLVDQIDITAPAGILDEGVLLIDTPGLDDTERFRVALTEQVVAGVDAILFLTQSGGSYGQSEKDFLLSLLRKGTVKQLIVVVTQIDQTYQKVLKEAEDNDEDAPSLADCIQREQAKIRRDITDTLKDLGSDPSLQRYQEQLGEVPIAFTSARLHRDSQTQTGGLPFVITPQDPGGVVGLKSQLLKLLSEESRLASTAQQIVKGASQTLEDLKGVLDTKLQVLGSTQDQKEAEQKLATFRQEFGTAGQGFTGSVEQAVNALQAQLLAQKKHDQRLLGHIATEAELRLAEFETEDMAEHWRTRRNGGWGHMFGLTGRVAGQVFPLVQGLLNDRTEQFNSYATAFESALQALAHTSEHMATQLELGGAVVLDVPGKLRVVLDRALQRAQALTASNEQEVLTLLDQFVTDEVGHRIAEARQRVSHIWDRGTTARQDAEVKAFYKEVKNLLKEALLSHLQKSCEGYDAFLLNEAAAAPLEALGKVQELFDQASENIVAATSAQLAGQREQAQATIVTVQDELGSVVRRIGGLSLVARPLPQAAPPQPTAVAVATPEVAQSTIAAPPDALPLAAPTQWADTPDWAETVQAQASVLRERLTLQENATGWTYPKLFNPALLNGAVRVSLVDPYLASPNQLRNLSEFLLHVAETARPKAIEILTAPGAIEFQAARERVLNQVSKDLFRDFGVLLTMQIQNGLHDRCVRLDNGVLFKLGRGLDIYKPATGLAAHRPGVRRVRATEIDVFVVPAPAQPNA